MYDAVLQGQRWAIHQIRDGASGAPIHQGILDLFRSKGFPTGEVGGHREGFFHGTGHGVGLEIHEAPRISSVPAILREGHVVTVEPGLYYPDLGGVRLEDIVVVTARSSRNLMKYKKVLEI
jgi:Xaa-Pro aminopeptidase